MSMWDDLERWRKRVGHSPESFWLVYPFVVLALFVVFVLLNAVV